MRRTHYYGSWTEPAAHLIIPDLPFLPSGYVPPCTDAPETFEQAGDERRGVTQSRADRRRIAAAERAAKSICGDCPVLDGCRRYALETRQRWGIWGATNVLERDDWHRRQTRRARKTTTTPTPPPCGTPRARPATATAEGHCPECLTQPVTLSGRGEHLVWTEHTYRTWGGTSRVCQASGVGLCIAPEPAGKPYNAAPLECPHTTSPDPRAAA